MLIPPAQLCRAAKACRKPQTRVTWMQVAVPWWQLRSILRHHCPASAGPGWRKGGQEDRGREERAGPTTDTGSQFTAF